jgi:hypothetical protein
VVKVTAPGVKVGSKPSSLNACLSERSRGTSPGLALAAAKAIRRSERRVDPAIIIAAPGERHRPEPPFPVGTTRTGLASHPAAWQPERRSGGNCHHSSAGFPEEEETRRSADCLLASLRRVAAHRERGTVILKRNPGANLPKKIFTPKARRPNRHFVN